MIEFYGGEMNIMINDPFKKRYPLAKSEYLKAVGTLLPHRIGQILQNLGYTAHIESIHSNGVDLKVSSNEDLFLVAEILNWSPYTELNYKRRSCIQRNLCKYNCYKVLIYTSMKNSEILEPLLDEGIILLCLDNQILPKVFHEFYQQRNQVENRTVDCKENIEHVRRKIISCLSSFE